MPEIPTAFLRMALFNKNQTSRNMYCPALLARISAFLIRTAERRIIVDDNKHIADYAATTLSRA
jgi:hypothetical protein